MIFSLISNQVKAVMMLFFCLMLQLVDYFDRRGSTVYVASLDISKASDKVQHDKLSATLHSTGLPLCVVLVLENWYSKLYACVRWNGIFSDVFKVTSGVRQRSTIYHISLLISLIS
jgi:hypothetical protein